MAAAIAGCVIPPSRSSTIWMRSRCVDGSFHRSAVWSRRTSALLHLTICSSRIRWSQRITPQIPKTTPPSTAFPGKKYADSCCSGAGMRDADTAGFGNALKPCRDVDAVPKDVMRLDDHVADVDAHTERNAPVFRIIHCKFMDTVLELHRSSNRLDRARKLRQEPVAGILHDVAAVFCDYRLDNVCQERRQTCVRRPFAA